MGTLKQQAISETYTDVEKLIHNICHKFIKRHFNPFNEYDDLSSEANLLFLDAYQNYNPEKGPFTNHIHFTIWHGLLEKMENSFKKIKSVCEVNEFLPAKNETTSLDDLLCDLSNDGKTMINLIRSSPKEIQQIMRTEKPHVRRPHCKLKSIMKGIGWSSEQIIKTINEIKEVIQDGH